MSAEFVLIAGAPRSGSTLVSDSLTEWPNSFIHVEPGLTWGRLNCRGLNVGEPWAASLAAPSAAASVIPPGVDPIDHYVNEVLPLMPPAQIGVKEVAFRRFRHRRLLRGVGASKVVVTVRDPRDTWVSLGELGRRLDAPNWSFRGLDLEAIAARFTIIYRHLAELADDGALVVRYEDLCTDVGMVDSIRRFVGSAAQHQEFGSWIGHFGRSWETDRHGTGIGSSAIGRWASEPDSVQRDALRFSELVAAEVARFGY